MQFDSPSSVSEGVHGFHLIKQRVKGFMKYTHNTGYNAALRHNSPPSLKNSTKNHKTRPKSKRLQ